MSVAITSIMMMCLSKSQVSWYHDVSVGITSIIIPLAPSRVKELVPGRVRELAPSRVRELVPSRADRASAMWETTFARNSHAGLGKDCTKILPYSPACYVRKLTYPIRRGYFSQMLFPTWGVGRVSTILTSS